MYSVPKCGLVSSDPTVILRVALRNKSLNWRQQSGPLGGVCVCHGFHVSQDPKGRIPDSNVRFFFQSSRKVNSSHLHCTVLLSVVHVGFASRLKRKLVGEFGLPKSNYCKILLPPNISVERLFRQQYFPCWSLRAPPLANLQRCVQRHAAQAFFTASPLPWYQAFPGGLCPSDVYVKPPLSTWETFAVVKMTSQLREARIPPVSK